MPISQKGKFHRTENKISNICAKVLFVQLLSSIVTKE
jgi:hypothetical protein